MSGGNFVVRTGVCIDPNDHEYESCVVDPSHCQSDHIYLSARETVLTNRNTCIADFLTIGRCTSHYDDNVCAYQADQCQDPTMFKFGVMELCSVRKDSDEHRTTYYGECANANESYCVLSPNDCRKGVEDYIPHSENCNCEMVSTGYCHHPKIHKNQQDYCALDADACDEDSIWVSAREAMDNNVPCKLCGAPKTEPDIVIPVPTNPFDVVNSINSNATTTHAQIIVNGVNTSAIPPTSATNENTVPDITVLNMTRGDSSASSSSSSSNNSSSNDSNGNGASIAGSVIGVMVAFPLLVYALFWMKKKRQNAAFASSSSSRQRQQQQQRLEAEMEPYSDKAALDLI
jgi:hypothetical protein